MYKKSTYILSFIIILTCTSCQHISRQEKEILTRAESLLYQNADSSLVLLNSIPDPQKMRKENYYKFFLLKTEAKDKNDKDVTSDTLVFQIKDYFTRKGDFHNAAKAAYLSGRINRILENYEKATQSFLEAEKYSETGSDYNQKGLIKGALGEVYYSQLLKDEAIVSYKKAANNFHQAKNPKNECIALNMIGNCFLLMNMPDSAITFYHKGLSIADKYNLSNEKFSIQQCLGVTYRETKSWENAKRIFTDILDMPVDSIEKARLYYNLATVFKGTSQYDSAVVCLNSALDFLHSQEDVYLLANIYKTRSLIDEQKQNFSSALNNHKLYSKYLASILEANKNRAILEIQKKYNFQTLQNQNNQLIIDRQRSFIIVSALLLAIIILLFVYYRHVMKHKKESLEIEKRIYQLKEMARATKDEKDSFRSVLLEHFGILKKAALLEIYLREDEKRPGKHIIKMFNKVVYGQEELDWNKFYKTMDTAYNGLFSQMKKLLQELNETEFRICCLAYAGLSNTETAIILGYSSNTIQTRKSLIRKKLDVDNFANFRRFLDEKMNIK